MSKFPALLAAALVSTLTAIACTKTDSVTAADASSHSAGTAVAAPAKGPATKPESVPDRAPKRPLHERARVWLT